MSVPQTDVFDDEPLEDEDTEDTEGSVDSDDEPATDNVGDPSVEINVEELLQSLEEEAGSKHAGDKGGITRQRLEELMESRRARRDLEDFDDYIV
jgi:hypothetical protein